MPSGQGIPVRVDASGERDVRVALDDAPPRALSPPYATWLDADPGAHQLTLFVDGRAVQTVRYRVD